MNDSFIYLTKIIREYNKDGLRKITAAYGYAADKHKNQYRESGEPYIVHPIAVAIILAKKHADTDTICAALLHDTMEDTNATKEEIEKLFGSTVATLVEGVTNLSETRYNKEETNVANLRRIILGMVKDIRIILIKLADRLHNIRTLQYKKVEKQKSKAIETMDIYVPIAHLLGLYDIKTELEDLCFKYLRPEDYKKIFESRQKTEQEFEKSRKIVTEELINLLDKYDIPSEVRFRLKSIYSIYKSMMAGKSYQAIDDLLIFRVIVEELNDCYRSLQYIHEKYIPLQGGMEDLIARPSGLYQAFHTNVWTKENTQVQIQLQTKQMATISDLGVTSVWHYGNQDNLEPIYGSLFESILKINEDADNNKDFIETMKGEVFAKKITVYDQSGVARQIPAGSTALDFAYYIHTEVGNKTIAVFIDGHPCKLNTVLENDNKVEIITDERVTVTHEWTNLVRTRRASKKIKEALNKQKKASN